MNFKAFLTQHLIFLQFHSTLYVSRRDLYLHQLHYRVSVFEQFTVTRNVANRLGICCAQKAKARDGPAVQRV